MSYLNESIDSEIAAATQAEPLWAAVVAGTALADTDLLHVTIPGLDESLRFGPCRWMPRVQTVTVDVAQGAEAANPIQVAQVVMPTRGDPCLVAFDDQLRPWIAVWYPAGWGGT